MGVNKYQPEKEDLIDVLQIDNRSVTEHQASLMVMRRLAKVPYIRSIAYFRSHC